MRDALRRRGHGYVWGFVDQGLSSATSFGLFLLAGRALGPSGLGVVTIGVSAYWLVLGFQRSLLTTPLVAASAALNSEGRAPAIRRGFALEFGGAAAATLLVLVLGLVVPGNAGRGLLIVAPWLAPALVQDYWRAILFQERRPAGAVVNDAAWVLIMAATMPLAWLAGADWALIGSWGAGALGAALVGFGQLRTRPTSARVAVYWWKARLWPFGRWLGLEGAVYSMATSGTVFILNGLLGAAAVGGLRAAESVFAPLSLIVPAITLPGLPAVARALAVSQETATRLASGLSAAVGVLAALYAGVMILLGGRLIPEVFGGSFSAFADLAWPIGTWQVVLGAGTGFAILLTAQERGRELLVIRGTAAVASAVFVAVFAWTSGVTGAAWGLALGGGWATCLTVVYALRAHGHSRSA